MGRLRSGGIAIWLAVIMAVCVIGISGVASFSFTKRHPFYVGRTTVMLQHRVPGISLQGLAKIVTGPEVKANAVKTLGQLGVSLDPEYRMDVTAQIVKDTHILGIEVTCRDPEVAKVAADVFAAELRKVVKARKGTTALSPGKTGSKRWIRVVSQVSTRKDGSKYTTRAVIAPVATKTTPSLTVEELIKLGSNQTTLSKAAKVSRDAGVELKTLRMTRIQKGSSASIVFSSKNPKASEAVVRTVIRSIEEQCGIISAEAGEPLKVVEPARVFPKGSKFPF